MIPEWPASFGTPEYDEMRPLILDHADKMLNRRWRFKLNRNQKDALMADRVRDIARGFAKGGDDTYSFLEGVADRLQELAISPPVVDQATHSHVTQLIGSFRDVAIRLAEQHKCDCHRHV